MAIHRSSQKFLRYFQNRREDLTEIKHEILPIGLELGNGAHILKSQIKLLRMLHKDDPD